MIHHLSNPLRQQELTLTRWIAYFSDRELILRSAGRGDYGNPVDADGGDRPRERRYGDRNGQCPHLCAGRSRRRRVLGWKRGLPTGGRRDDGPVDAVIGQRPAERDHGARGWWVPSCMLTTDGDVVCWGRNSFGQLGDGTRRPSRSTAAMVDGLAHGATAVVAGENHTCAVTTGGSLVCWG